jgi:phage gp29-like protein
MLSFIKRLIPTSAATSVSDLGEPMSVSSLNMISADQLAVAIRSAESGDTRGLMTFYRDNVLTWSHLQAEFAKRKMPVLVQPVTVLPYLRDNPLDVACAEALNSVWELVPDRTRALAHLLDSVLYPVAVVEKVFTVEAGRYVLSALVPVPHHLLDYRTGVLRIRVTDQAGKETGATVEADPARYIIHRAHILSSPDKLGGPMRAIIYWWLFSTQSRDWWLRFLQRYGLPVMVGRYPHGATDQRAVLIRAMSTLNRALGLAITKDTELEFKSVGTLNGDSFVAVQEFANKEVSKLILGQTLSAESQASGLGSGNADLHGAVRDDLALFDRATLAETLRDQLYAQLAAINGLPGNVPRVMLGPAVDPSDILAMLKALREGGLRPADSALATIAQQVGFDVVQDTSPQAPLASPAAAAFSALLSALD